MTKYSRAEAVRMLKEADVKKGQSNFLAGDVALDQCPIGSDGVNNGSAEDLRALAEEAGVSYDSLYQYRFVASRTPPMTRVIGVAWSAYREVALAVRDDAERDALFRRLATETPGTISGRWTVNAVRPLIDRKPIVHTNSEPVADRVREAPLADRVEVARSLLIDPEVRAAARDIATPLGGAVFGVAEEAKAQRSQEGEGLARIREARTETDPVLKGLDESQAIGDLTGACFDFAKKVAALLPRIGHLPNADNDPLLARHFLREANVRAKGATEQVDDLLRTGKVGGGVDAFLKSVLEGGAKG